MSRLVPAGFGVPFWAERVQAALPDEPEDEEQERAAIAPVLEELIAQTRLDEAMACNRAIAPALGLDARIADHKKELRRAQRRARSK